MGRGIDAAFKCRRHVRFVNGRDPVTRVPPRFMGYRHHGELVRLTDPDGPSVRYDHSIVYYAEVLEMSGVGDVKGDQA